MALPIVVIVDKDGNQALEFDSQGNLPVTLASGDQLRIDSMTKGVTVIQAEHNKVHQGLMYKASYIFDSVDDDDYATLLIRTGATKEVHAVFAISAGGDTFVHLHEDPTVSVVGIETGIYNMKRGISGSGDTMVYYTPTITESGDMLLDVLIPGGTGVNFSGGERLRIATEWILQANQDYLLNARNVAGSAQPISMSVELYEVS